MNNHYDIPVDFSKLYTGQKLSKSDVERSVIQHIYLMLMTHLGAYTFDRNYGSTLWDNDFDLNITAGNWSQEIESSLTTTITQNEPRIYKDIVVKVYVEKIDTDESKNQKQRFSVSVQKMRLTDTNEAIDDVDFSILFSPITVE